MAIYKNIDTLAVSITNACNEACKFCLRGDAGDQYMSKELIPKIFEGIGSVNVLCLTGGEPSMYASFVTDIVKYIIENNIDVNGLYIVTNGKVYCQPLVDAVKDMLNYYFVREYSNNSVGLKFSTKNKEIMGVMAMDSIIEETMYRFGLALSIDNYHEPISAVNYVKYKTSGVYCADHVCDFSASKNVIARGRGKDIAKSFTREVYPLYAEMYEDGDDIIANFERVFVSIDGKVFGDCDLSYKQQENIKPYGNISDSSLSAVLDEFVSKEFEETA